MDRRLPINERLRALLNTTRSRPAGWRQPQWTWMDRILIRLLARRRYAPEGRGSYLIWE